MPFTLQPGSADDRAKGKQQTKIRFRKSLKILRSAVTLTSNVVRRSRSVRSSSGLGLLIPAP